MNSPLRRSVVGGNWKMNTTLPESAELARRLVELLGQQRDCTVVLCPPFTNLDCVRAIIQSTELELGAQDVFWEDKGAFTGEISVSMLRSVGAGWVICGHSERRHLLGETNEVVNRKLHAALRGGMSVILAVGETESERRSGDMDSVLSTQLRGSLAAVEAASLEQLVLAYEPVWAIGTGLTATPGQAEEAHAFIRGWMSERYGEDSAGAIRIQYGGSVTAANVQELMAMPDVDGALVGGASLKPDEFAAIVRAAGTRAA